MIDGSAMRRRRVNTSAMTHAAPATSNPAVVAPASVAPTAAAANTTSTHAIDTKMSLKPVTSRNCSSSTIGVARIVATWSRSAAAACAEISPASTAD